MAAILSQPRCVNLLDELWIWVMGTLPIRFVSNYIKVSKNKTSKRYWHYHINGLVQERRNSSALAMELSLSCTSPSNYVDDIGNWFLGSSLSLIGFVAQMASYWKCPYFFISTWQQGLNVRHFANSIFECTILKECILLKENICILIKISVNFVPKGLIINNSLWVN